MVRHQAIADSVDSTTIVPADSQEDGIVPVFNFGASVAAAKLNLLSSSCRHLVEFASHKDATLAIDGILQSATDLSSYAVDPALYHALVLANRNRKRQSIQDPVVRALQPYLAKSPLKRIVGLQASSQVFLKMAQRIAPKLPEPPPAKYLLPPSALDDRWASELTRARFKLVTSSFKKLAGSAGQAKQVISEDMFLCVVRSSVIIGLRTSTNFYHMVSASGGSGPEPARQEFHEFEVVGDLMDGIVSTVIQKMYEPYVDPYPDCDTSGPFDMYTIGPAVSISSDELAASIANGGDRVQLHKLKVKMIPSTSLDLFSVCEAVETSIANPIPTSVPSSRGIGGLLEMLRTAHVDKSRRSEPPVPIAPDITESMTKPEDDADCQSDCLEKWLEEMLDDEDYMQVFNADREDDELELQETMFHGEPAATVDAEEGVDESIDIPDTVESWDDFLRRIRLTVTFVWRWVSFAILWDGRCG
jgi:hypothetical protein